MHKRTVSVFMAVVAVIVLATACGSSSSTSSGSAKASGGTSASTISVSVPCPISGPNPVPECATSVQAYFDQVNAAGGVNGHKLKAVICDTQLNPVTEADCLKNAIADS
jgi:branched-chain amino acid transport system substrate-binding protein